MQVDFDFARICTQGALISTYTPRTLQQYIDLPTPPANSRYHLVGCSIEMLPVLAKMDPERIVFNCLKHTSNRYCRYVFSKVIVDLCLPYHDPYHKTYLGRYILLGGRLIAIRLCTSRLQHLSFSEWPRHNVKTVTLSRLNPSNCITIGQFSINLKNARLALLFSSQLPLLATQYISYNFDMVLMVQNSLREEINRAKRNRLENHTVLVWTSSGNYCQLIGREELREIVQGSVPECPKNVICLDYYSLDAAFASKSFNILKPQLLVEIPAIQLNVFLAQPQPQSLPLYSNPHCFLASKITSNQQSLRSIRPQLKTYLSRLLTLLWHCHPTRPLVFLDSSPTALSFLFLLSQLIIQSGASLPKITSLFTFIGIHSRQLELVVSRVGLFEEGEVSLIDSEEYSSVEGAVLELLDRVAGWSSQEWWVVIGEGKALKNVIEMMNKRPKRQLKQEEVMQSWILSCFFNEHELTQISLSPQFQSLINCKECLQMTPKMRPPPKQRQRDLLGQIVKVELSQFQLERELKLAKIQTLMDCGNPFFYGFGRWLREGDWECDGKGQIMAHYLVRRVNAISYEQNGENTRTTLQLLLSLPRSELPLYFDLLTPQSHNSLTLLQHEVSLNHLSDLKASTSSKTFQLSCSNCHEKYPQDLLFKCLNKQCQECFCYGCLFEKYGYSYVKLGERQGRGIRVGLLGKCPKCRGIQEKDQSQSLNKEKEACHLCKIGTSSGIGCDSAHCSSYFCVGCLSSLDLPPAQEITEWRCPICLNNCPCSICRPPFQFKQAYATPSPSVPLPSSLLSKIPNEQTTLLPRRSSRLKKKAP